LTVHFALFLSPDGIALAHRQGAGHWAFLGDVSFDAPNLDGAMAKLRAKGEEREGKGFATILVLPDDQILYTSLTAPTGDDELTTFRIEEGLEGLTPYAVTELVYDWRTIEEDRVKLAVVAQETLDEARAFAEGHGFNGVGFAAMPPLEKFPGVPLFDLSGPAHGLSFPDEGLAFGADAWDETTGATPDAPQSPDEAAEATDVPEADADAADTADAPAEPAPADPEVIEPAEDEDKAPAPDQRSPDKTPGEPAEAAIAADGTSEAETVSAGDKPQAAPEQGKAETVAAERDAPTKDAPSEESTPEDETPPNPITDPMLDGPVAPLPPEDEAEAEDAKSAPDAPRPSAPAAAAPSSPVPFLDDMGADGDDDLPPLPATAVLAARQRAQNEKDDGKTSAGKDGKPSGPAPSPGSPDAAVPTFSARRAKDAPPADTPTGAASVAQRKPRIGFAATRPQPTTGKAPTAPASDAPTKAPADAAKSSPLTSRLTRLRDISRAKPRDDAATPPPQAKGRKGGTPPAPGAAKPSTPDPLAKAAAKAAGGSAKVRRPKRGEKAPGGAPTSGASGRGRLTGLLGSAKAGAAGQPAPGAPKPTEAARTGRLSGLLDAARQGAKGLSGQDKADTGADRGQGRQAKLSDRLGTRTPTAPTPADAAPESRLSALGAALRSGDPEESRAQPTPAGKTAPAPDDATTADGAFSSGLLARKSDTTAGSGPSLRTGLILTVVLLVLLALIAIWSVLFLPDSPMARWVSGSDTIDVAAEDPLTAPAPPAAITAPPAIGQLGEAPNPAAASATAPVQRPEIAAAAPPEAQSDAEDEAAADGVDLAALEAADPAEPVAVPEAAPAPAQDLPDIDAELDLPPLPPTPEDLLPSLEETQQIYAEDGIWPRTPERPDPGSITGLNDLYVASIDPTLSTFDALALPAAGVNPSEMLRRMPPPPPFGTEIDTDARGLVVPTPEGVVTPDGALVIQGRPDIVAVPRPRENAPEPTAQAPVVNGVEGAILATFQPTPRPTDLDETRERQVLGGLTLGELNELRPDARPLSAQEAAAQASLFPGDDADADADADAAALPDGQEPEIQGTALAVAQSLVPPTRPANIDELVASAERAPEPTAPAVAPSQIAPQPQIPSNADVARAATERNALRLRDLNLIGVTGTNSSRRALVRLPSGRFVRVAVGDSLNGGTVAAIGESTLQYVRNGRTITLEVPG